MLRSFCVRSKELYNRILYIYRNAFAGSLENISEYVDCIQNERFIRPYNLMLKMKKVKDPAIMNMPKAQAAQQVILQVDRVMKAFFKAHKAWKANPKKFSGKPKMPDYKDSLNTVVYTNQDSRIKFNKIWLSKAFSIAKLRTDIVDYQQIRLVPSPCGLKVEIVYNVGTPNLPDVFEIDIHNSAGVDLGIKNLATIASETHSCVFNGRGLLSINHFYHKKAAENRATCKANKVSVGKKMNTLNKKHNNKISDYLHKTSRNIVKWVVEGGLRCLFIGRNVDWKQNVNIGRRNNQNFCSIPHWRLIQMITYKAAEVGIRVELVQESHTSKCSFLDNESIRHHDEYVGKRVKRGLFRASDGRIINADVNGALNIMKRGLECVDSFAIDNGVFRTKKKNPNATRNFRVGKGAVLAPEGKTSERDTCLEYISKFDREKPPCR